MEKTRLVETFETFLKDLKKVYKSLEIPNDIEHEKLKDELSKIDENIKNITLYDIEIGKIYDTQSTKSKKAILEYIDVLKKLSTDEKGNEIVTVPIAIPTPQDLFSKLSCVQNFSSLSNLVQKKTNEGTTPYDTFMSVVNDQEFKDAFNSIVKDFST